MIIQPKHLVTQIRCHIGVQVLAEVKTSFDLKRDNAEMELHPLGVAVCYKGQTFIVPSSNIHSILLGERPNENDTRGPARKSA